MAGGPACPRRRRRGRASVSCSSHRPPRRGPRGAPAPGPAPPPAATRAVVGLMLVTSTAEAVAARRPARGLGLVAAAGAVGFAAEAHGVATGRPFGAYRYSDRLGPRVVGVPLLAAAAWALLA